MMIQCRPYISYRLRSNMQLVAGHKLMLLLYSNINYGMVLSTNMIVVCEICGIVYVCCDVCVSTSKPFAKY